MGCADITYVKADCNLFTCGYFYCPKGFNYSYTDCCNYGWSQHGWMVWTFPPIFILLLIIGGVVYCRKRRQRQMLKMEEQKLLNQQSYAPEQEVVFSTTSSPYG